MFKIIGWSSFQSYKDRRPPWIRLHKNLLDNYQFQMMSADARAILPMLWLIASEDEDPVSGLLRFGYTEISFRLRQPEKTIKSAIAETIKAGFVEDVLTSKESTKTVSYKNVTDSLRNCHPETETETETETESILIEKDTNKMFSDFWEMFPRQRRGSKEKAEQAWDRAACRTNPEEILAGCAAYALSREVKEGFGKGAAAWLNDDRWTHDYSDKLKPKTKGYDPNDVLTNALNDPTYAHLRRGGGDNRTDDAALPDEGGPKRLADYS